MKLWISGEVQSDVGNFFREASICVENTINDVISNKEYDIELNDWDCIAILRSDSSFEDITKYSKKKMEMDFRLQLNYVDFKKANKHERESMIFKMLQRSLTILKDKGVNEEELEVLITDVLKVGENKNWT